VSRPVQACICNDCLARCQESRPRNKAKSKAEVEPRLLPQPRVPQSAASAAIQEAAYSHGSYGGPLDNYSGPNTINGVKGLQAYFGLSQDGCAGPATWGRVRQYFQYVGPPPGYVSDGPNYLIQYGARNQYYSYNGCWASFAYGGTASPVASYRYYELSASLIGLTPQAPLNHGGALPYCGTV